MSDQQDDITQTIDQPAVEQQTDQQPTQGESHEGAENGQQGQPDEQKKPEPTPAEKEAKALRRRIDRLTRNKYQSEAQIAQLQQELDQSRGHESQGQDDHPANPQDMQRQAREMVEVERINARCEDVVATGEKTYQDFPEKVRELGQELKLFDKSMRPTEILKSILDADNPAALIYHLGSNPDLAAELADLSPRQQTRRLIQIEGQIGKTPTAQKTVSKAPPPAQPNRSASGSFEKDPSKMSDDEWWAAEQSKTRKR